MVFRKSYAQLLAQRCAARLLPSGAHAKALTLCYALLASTALLTTACNNDTTNLGADLMPEADKVFTEQQTVIVPTQTVRTGVVAARTNNSYLGSVIDPLTNIRTTNGFVTQFYVPEITPFPARDKMLQSSDGNVLVDSCSLTFWHVNYFGDSLATQRVTVKEIDPQKTPEGTTTYFTNIQPDSWVKADGEQQTTSYSVYDQTQPRSQVENRNNYRYFNIALTKEFGQRIVNAYYAHPEYFKDSYSFAHNVLGGFYFQHSGGLGAMVEADHVSLNLYYRYRPDATNHPDSIVNDMQVFTSTDEVIQTSRIDNEIPQQLINDQQNFTYIKAPAALHTEAILPVDDIVAGNHYADSINSASLYLRILTEDANQGQLPSAPPYLVMVRAGEINNFFASHQLPDGKTSFYAQLDRSGTATSKATYSYPFTNIAPLITQLRNERDAGAGVLPTDNETTRKAKWAIWEQQHPNWNRVALLPASPTVVLVYNATTQQNVPNLVRLNYAFGLYGVRLLGGLQNGVEMSVIYSRFNN